jgi:iron complex outermembrane receptor protein
MVNRRSSARVVSRTSLAVLAAGALSLVSPCAFGQEGGESKGAETSGVAVIEGRVLGPDGAAAAGVEVRLQSGTKTLKNKAISSADGTFRIEGVPAPGVYQLECSLGHRVENGPAVAVRGAGEVVNTEVSLQLGLSEEVSVTADAWTLPDDVPNSVVMKTAEKLSEQNLVNPEDALKYAPSTVIRKRYIGDRNALIGGRSFGTLQPSRGLVFLEGYLISNFLGRFDAPRWNMITPEALERVDILYGPFSAIHAGNSIGTTVVMTERTPKRLEYGLNLTGYSQSFEQYDDQDRYGGGQLSGYVGGRFRSGWGALTYNHQTSTSQPMQYFNVTANASGAFPNVSGTATPVSGIHYDTDPRGLRRAVFGGNSGAIDHTVQDSLKLRFGYAFTRELEASALVAGWRNDSDNSNRTFLRDANGNEVWQGLVTDGTNTFSIPATAFARSTRYEKHRHLGFTLRSRRDTGWNGSAVASEYRILDDPARQANFPDPVAQNGGVGTVTRRDGTGWNTLEAQATYTPTDGDFLGGRHALVFGVHRNAYTLTNVVNNSTDWRINETTLGQRFRGETEVYALYAQDAFDLAEDFKLTIGWRGERFRTFDGEQLARVSTCTPTGAASCVPNGDGSFNKVVPYESRNLSGHSPKASLAWTASDHLLLKASFGRGVRFPNVEELYNGSVTATTVTVSDPNLKAERSNAFELAAETYWSRHTLRTSLFHDDVHDAILRQSNNTVTPSITNVSNQDLVRTSGVELAWSARDLGVRGLSLEASAAFTRSKVVENAKDPLSEGKYWLRVPKARGNFIMAYRPTAKWMGSIGYRYSSAAFNDVYNLDTNPNVYGGISKVNQVDLRVSHKPLPQLELAVGMDNVTDSHSYQSHPLPGRTVFLQLRTSSH